MRNTSTSLITQAQVFTADAVVLAFDPRDTNGIGLGPIIIITMMMIHLVQALVLATHRHQSLRHLAHGRRVVEICQPRLRVFEGRRGRGRQSSEPAHQVRVFNVIVTLWIIPADDLPRGINGLLRGFQDSNRALESLQLFERRFAKHRKRLLLQAISVGMCLIIESSGSSRPRFLRLALLPFPDPTAASTSAILYMDIVLPSSAAALD